MLRSILFSLYLLVLYFLLILQLSFHFIVLCVLFLQAVKAQLAKDAWLEQQQVGGTAGTAAGGAGSSRAAAAAGRAAASGQLGIRVDDIRRLMDL